MNISALLKKLLNIPPGFASEVYSQHPDTAGNRKTVLAHSPLMARGYPRIGLAPFMLCLTHQDVVESLPEYGTEQADHRLDFCRCCSQVVARVTDEYTLSGVNARFKESRRRFML